MIDIYHKRIKQFFMATLGFVSLVFVACLPVYPYFRLPLHPNLVLGTMVAVLILGFVLIPLSFILRKRFFPVNTQKDKHWSQKATGRYFWLYLLVSIPFIFSFFVYLIFAPLSLLILGYLLTVFSLILLRPRKEDLV